MGFGTEAWLAVGDLARAASMAREALEIGERLGNPTARGVGECALCRVRVQEGDLDAATSLAEQWVESARSAVKFQVPWAISTLAVLRGARGERDEAHRLAHEALAFAETGGLQLGQLWSELALARIHLSDGTAAACAEAAAWLARAEQTLETTGFFARLPDLLELRAELARQRGDAAGREAALREALRVYQENGAAPHAERIARELAS